MAKDLKYMMDAKVSAVKVSADQKGGGIAFTFLEDYRLFLLAVGFFLFAW